MNLSNKHTSEESAILYLKGLFKMYGYNQYKMNKFEEYDFYLKNKNFLESENIITFNDLNGRLMALKPDITLSIVKNTKGSSCAEKVFYSENVYRVANGTNEFKEIMQLGLECIGDIDLYQMAEVILLAAKSLQSFSKNFILDISHMGLVSGLLDNAALNKKQQNVILKQISKKNAHEIKKSCQQFNVSEQMTEKIVTLTSLYGSFETVLETVEALNINETTNSAIKELKNIYEILKNEGFESNVNIDFSIINDMNYYNGVIFQGLIDGIPSCVLSGGSYDNLLKKFGKDAQAIGFAIHLDKLDRIYDFELPFDVDVLLLYDESAKATEVALAVRKLMQQGKSVKAQKGKGSLKYKQLIRLVDGRLKNESND